MHILCIFLNLFIKVCVSFVVLNKVVILYIADFANIFRKCINSEKNANLYLIFFAYGGMIVSHSKFHLEKVTKNVRQDKNQKGSPRIFRRT